MWALLVTGFLVSSQTSEPATKPAEFNGQELQKIVEQAMGFWRVPGVAIAIVKGEKTLFEGGFGVVKVSNRPDYFSAGILQQKFHLGTGGISGGSEQVGLGRTGAKAFAVVCPF
jgi:hypothetical protein